MPFIPHTDEDISAMLSALQLSDIDQLFTEIPEELRYNGLKNIPEGNNEMHMLHEAAELSKQNNNGICFIGAGAYDHHIPAAVWDIASRGEYLTSYTPYQAEASQGTLQLLYEFQTMIAELTGMEVANASLYDGASALAEAVLMAVRIKKSHESAKILIAGNLHPFYRETLETIVRNQSIELVTIPFNEQTGTLNHEYLIHSTLTDATALVVAQPNFFGGLEGVDELCDWAHSKQIICIASVNPTSLALLKPPGHWGEKGADIVCGEGQPLGVPMASGGPNFGFLSTKMEYVRQIPGRLIGRTVDKLGNPGFSLTLQAREQHIRRGKATSNICTNQGLLVTAATIYMSLLGAEGLRAVAIQCHQNTDYLVKRLSSIEGVTQVFNAPFFHEAVLRFDRPLNGILTQLQAVGISAGYPIDDHFPGFSNCLLICATEMRSRDEIDFYYQTLQHIMSNQGN